MQVGENKEQTARDIRLKRKKLGLTQKKFAELLKIHPDQLSRYERGKTVPGADIYQRIVGFEDAVREPAGQYEPERTELQRMFGDVKEIIETGRPEIVAALKANIKAFLQAAREMEEKRRSSRLLLNIPVTLQIRDTPHVEHHGTVINISKHGLLIESSVLMNLEIEVNINISFSKNDKTDSFVAVGQIVWRDEPTALQSQSWKYGVKFIDVPYPNILKLKALATG